MRDHDADSEPPPPLTAFLLQDEDALEEVVLEHARRAPAPSSAGEVESILSVLQERLDEDSWAQLNQALDLIAQRHEELLVQLVTMAIENASGTVEGDSGADAGHADDDDEHPVVFTAANIDDPTKRGQVYEALFMPEPRYRWQSAHIRWRQRRLHRLVDDRAWHAFLRLEDATTARYSDDLDQAVLAAFEAGRRADRGVR